MLNFVCLNMLLLNTFRLSSSRNIMYENAREKSCPIVYHIGKPQLYAHPFGHAVLLADRPTANPILKGIIVNFVNYFVQMM